MDQINEFFSGLFETHFWPPRWHCGRWTDFHGWLYIISNILIGIAYFSIPIILLTVIRKHKTPFAKLIFFFTLFILSCGITHVLDAIIFWEPLYRLNALFLAITACISLFTAYILFRKLPAILNFKSPDALAEEIIQRKSIEEKYIQLNAELEQKVKERTLELKNSNEELKNFTSSVSHDLRSPIQNMMELAKLLKEEKVSGDAQLILNNLEKTAEHASSLIKDLYEISKNAQHELQKQRIVSDYFVGEIIKELKNNKHIDAKTSIDYQSNSFIYGDTTLLKQVYINLITNAYKYKKPGQKATIKINTVDQITHTTVSITDNGIGFDMNQHDLIFKIFKRADNTQDGTGIGLSIVKKIIERHGGKIWATSELDKGSTFYFTLPNS